MTPLLSPAERTAALEDLTPLGWALSPDRDALIAKFRFADFPAALAWMVRIGVAAEKMNHHPEWQNVYNRVEVTLTTHDAGGLTALDVALARHMSACAPI